MARIIPARAGYTTIRSAWNVLIWDHPRSRGVYPTWAKPEDLVLGSSPLARGLRVGIARLLVGHGIIPARAGFTDFLNQKIIDHVDHPRSRGGY